VVARLIQVPLWRWAVLYVLLAALVLATAACMGETVSTPSGVGRLVDLNLLLATPVWLLASAAYLVGAVSFTLQRRERLAGLLLFLALGVMGHAEMSVRDDSMVPLANLLAGNLLLAWLIGSGGGGSPEARARRGHAWMCGVYGAMLTLAGLNKVLHSGLGWFDGGMHSLYIWERAQPMVAPQLLRELRLFLADQPALCAASAGLTLAVECAGCLFVWERLRKPLAVAIVLMFTAMNLAMGLGEQGWGAVPVALAWGRAGTVSPARRPR
jgi:hypothetical protein